MTSEVQIAWIGVIMSALTIAQTALLEWIRRKKSDEQRGKLTQDVATEVHKRMTSQPSSNSPDTSEPLV